MYICYVCGMHIELLYGYELNIGIRNTRTVIVDSTDATTIVW